MDADVAQHTWRNLLCLPCLSFLLDVNPALSSMFKTKSSPCDIVSIGTAQHADRPPVQRPAAKDYCDGLIEKIGNHTSFPPAK